MSDSVVPKKILAVASAGGHWEQLQTLRNAFAEHEVHYVTTLDGLANKTEMQHVSVIPDCNANEKIKSLRSAVAIFRIILRAKPDIIISTGALPGFFALAIGKLTGRRTLWIDSVANVEEYSKAGRFAKHFADLRLTQWPEVAESEGGEFSGNLL